MAEYGLKISPERMREIGNKSGTMTEDLKTQSSDLKSKKAGLMQIWRGPSANEFDTGSEVHFQKLDEFQDVLYEMCNKIKAGADSYQKTEEDNVLETKRLQEQNYKF